MSSRFRWDAPKSPMPKLVRCREHARSGLPRAHEGGDGVTHDVGAH